MNGQTLRRLEALAGRARATLPPARANFDRYSITNAAGDRAVVYIYDSISEFGVSAEGFSRELRAISAAAIDLHINSPGGWAFDAIAIYSALRNHQATVDVSIDGVAASAASFIAMSGDSVVIEKPAQMMIHDAAAAMVGNAADMREVADLLDDVSDAVAGIYADRAGGTVAAWREAMRATTWYSSAEAVEAGLADQVVGDEQAAAPANRLRSQTIRARARSTLGGVR